VCGPSDQSDGGAEEGDADDQDRRLEDTANAR
jgi:hypothetical protein